mgnify:FL=1
MANLDRINELIGEKDFEKAQELIEPALKEEPDNIELLKLAGLTAVNQGNYDKARIAFETVVKYNHEDATSFFYLGSCYDNLGDLVSAKNAYLTVIKLRPDYLDGYKSLCIILMKLNEAEEAVKYAYKASAIDPEDYIFDFIIGTAYMKIKEFEKSIEPFKKALAKSPENLGTLNSLGTACIATGRSGEAISYYQKALELNPKNPMAYYNIGSAFQIQQNHEEACKYFRKAVELDNDEGFNIALAMSMVKIGQYKEAAEIYKSLLIMHPEKENYKFNLISCYEAMGEIQTAISMLEKIVYLNQKFILPAQKLASLYIKSFLRQKRFMTIFF